MQILNNFKNYYTQATNTIKPCANTLNPFIKYPNLAPLAKDTVSFGANIIKTESTDKKQGKREITQKDVTNLARALRPLILNQEQCEYVYENAKVAERYLLSVLRTNLRPYVYNNTSNPKGSIERITTRVKTPDSIKEKTMDALASVILKGRKNFQPYDSEDIKKVLGDIIGARIVLARSIPKQTTEIVNALIKAVRDEQLEITRIENYLSDDLASNKPYFNQNDLERLCKEVNSVRNPELEPLSVINTKKPTGYVALHLDVNLANPEWAFKNNRYKGEIQILGRDVEKLKEVEDLCYKRSTGKDIKGGNVAYSTFCDHFEKYINQTPQTNDLFVEYTKRAYALQRNKEPVNLNKKSPKKYNALPTIAQCNLEGKLPKELDFNKLAEIKRLCDFLYDATVESKN